MIKIGLLGAAWITPMAIIKPASELNNVKVTALAARDKSRAIDYAGEHGIPEVENDYDSLLARNDIDLIYIALPVSFHQQWVTKALSSGRHVLCEKPLVMNEKQALQVFSVAERADRYLIEAFHYKHHPYFKRVVEICQSGELGKITKMSGSLNVPVVRRNDQIRHSKILGGGALMDLGCYPINMIRAIAGEEPVVESANAVVGDSGVDLSIEANLSFRSGISASIKCEMPETGKISGCLVVAGELGTLTASSPILPHIGGKISVDTNVGYRIESANKRSTFSFQLEAISRMLVNGDPQFPTAQDSIGNAKAMDAIKRAAQLN